MKVDGTTSQQSTAAQQIDPKRDQDPAKASQKVQTGTDRVDLSSEAALLAEALSVLEQLPEVRQDLVERMRQRLTDGHVGDDAERLADSMIDRLLEQ